MPQKLLTLVCSLLLGGYCLAQDEILTNKQMAEQIRSLAAQGKETKSEQTRLIWTLLMRSMQGDKNAHEHGKAAAGRLTGEDDLNYRAKFALGFFRLREAYDTRDPVLRKRRIDEGRRAMTTSLPVGSRDTDFLFDAGMAMVGLEPNVELFDEGLNTLTLARRTMGANWDSVPKPRQADWHVSMAVGFIHAGLVELARDKYRDAYATAPDSASGQKAIVWLRSHGG